MNDEDRMTPGGLDAPWEDPPPKGSERYREFYESLKHHPGKWRRHPGHFRTATSYVKRHPKFEVVARGETAWMRYVSPEPTEAEIDAAIKAWNDVVPAATLLWNPNDREALKAAIIAARDAR